MRVVGVDAARADGAGLLGADVGLRRVRRVVIVHVLADVIVPAAHVNDAVEAGEIIAHVGRHGHLAGRVEAVDQVLHGLGHAPARGRGLDAFLVGDRPDHDAGVVAVAADQAFEAVQVGGVAAQQPVLIHDQHAEPVAGLEQFGRGRVVRGAIGVVAHLLEAGDAEILEPVGQGGAHAGMVLVVAGALEHVRLAIQQETFVGIERDRADAEFGGRLSTIWPLASTVVISWYNFGDSGDQSTGALNVTVGLGSASDHGSSLCACWADATGCCLD